MVRDGEGGANGRAATLTRYEERDTTRDGWLEKVYDAVKCATSLDSLGQLL